MGQEAPLEGEMATHSSTLAQKIPWTKEPGRLQSLESQKESTCLSTHVCLCSNHAPQHLLGCGRVTSFQIRGLSPDGATDTFNTPPSGLCLPGSSTPVSAWPKSKLLSQPVPSHCSPLPLSSSCLSRPFLPWPGGLEKVAWPLSPPMR